MKLRRLGIFSTSDGTLGLSRKKCTLSNVMLITCWMLLPSEHGAGSAIAPSIPPNIAPAATMLPTIPNLRIRLDPHMDSSPSSLGDVVGIYGAESRRLSCLRGSVQ